MLNSCNNTYPWVLTNHVSLQTFCNFDFISIRNESHMQCGCKKLLLYWLKGWDKNVLNVFLWVSLSLYVRKNVETSCLKAPTFDIRFNGLDITCERWTGQIELVSFLLFFLFSAYFLFCVFVSFPAYLFILQSFGLMSDEGGLALVERDVTSVLVQMCVLACVHWPAMTWKLCHLYLLTLSFSHSPKY